MEVGFKTDKGLRRSNNEDAFFVMKKDRIFIVADGVGGNNSGEIASRTCVSEIAKYVEKNPPKKAGTDEEMQAYFTACMRDVNFRVLELSQKFEENQGMATTVVLACVSGNRIHLVNVGDSRAYLLRKEKLLQITEDHTYVNTLIRAGLISPDEAAVHENRNMITRAVGADYTIDADFFHLDLAQGDVFLLCTDGLYGEVAEEELIRQLGRDATASDICEELVATANHNGGSDNITMIILKVTEEDIDE